MVFKHFEKKLTQKFTTFLLSTPNLLLKYKRFT